MAEQTQDQAPAAAANAEAPTVKLDVPVQHGSERITELRLRKPRAGDLRGVKITVGEAGMTLDLGAMLDLGANLAEVPPSVIAQLDLGDAMKVVSAVVPLLPASLRTMAAS